MPLIRLMGCVTGLIFMLGGAYAAEVQESGVSLDQQTAHVLNRIAFGPHPGDVAAVEKMGLHNYIEQQLHPETINDSVVEQELQPFGLLQMTAPELMDMYDTERKDARKKQQEISQAAATQGAMTAVPPAASQNTAGRSRPPRSTTAIGQLQAARLIRAVDSQRQLQEVLVDFWSNHFNIDVKKGLCRVLEVVDDRDVIRPHVFGRFRDLLEASARSPAMLFYLDNAENSVARPMLAALRMKDDEATPVQPAPRKRKATGINENYAREIMELHTLGVNGGYTQADVQEVARCFTGWTIDRQTGEFIFRPFLHDNGTKVVLGHAIPPAGGIQDGEKVLDILASQPATAHFISRELCQRFVSDDPPEALVVRIAAVFQKTDGDLRQVTEAVLTSPEFLSSSSFKNKIKSPLEFAASAIRATDSNLLATDTTTGFGRSRAALEGGAVLGKEQSRERLGAMKQQSLNWHLYELGEPLFACTPPTGYKENSKIWVSPGALIERLNFAMALTQRQVEDVRFDPKNILGTVDVDKPDAVLDQCVSALMQGDISSGTRQVLEKAALPIQGDSKTVDPSKLIALILGSPEFQRK